MYRLLIPVLAIASVFTLTNCSSDASRNQADAPVAGPAVTPSDSTAVPAAGAYVYACPMHPEVTSTKPGQKCPKCGMELVHND